MRTTDQHKIAVSKKHQPGKETTMIISQHASTTPVPGQRRARNWR